MKAMINSKAMLKGAGSLATFCMIELNRLKIKKKSVGNYEANTAKPSVAIRYPVVGGYLTQRESECVRLILSNKSYIEVGELLDLSTRTVQYYVNNVKKKFNLSNKHQVIQYFSQHSF